MKANYFSLFLLLTIFDNLSFAMQSEEMGPSVESIAISGRGCKMGALSYDIENNEYTLPFDNSFHVELGPSVPFSKSFQQCRLSLSILSDREHQYFFSEIKYEGETQLDEDVELLQKGDYYIQSFNYIVKSSTIKGPTDIILDIQDKILEPIWSDCGENPTLKLSTVLSLTSSSDEAIGHAKISRVKFKLQSQKCSFIESASN